MHSRAPPPLRGRPEVGARKVLQKCTYASSEIHILVRGKSRVTGGRKARRRLLQGSPYSNRKTSVVKKKQIAWNKTTLPLAAAQETRSAHPPHGHHRHLLFLHVKHTYLYGVDKSNRTGGGVHVGKQQIPAAVNDGRWTNYKGGASVDCVRRLTG